VRVAALLVIAFALAGCAIGGTTKTTTVTNTVTQTVTTVPTQNPAAPQTANARYFGIPDSVTKVDEKRYLLVLKPEFFLTGVTANVAYSDQQGTSCDPLACFGPPNDYFVIPAGTTPLTFVLPATTTGTVVVMGKAVGAKKVTAAQLAAFVTSGTTPEFGEPVIEGFWLTVDGDTVKSFTQQYRP
jgi:hypothetical protein